jgi:serpin B
LAENLLCAVVMNRSALFTALPFLALASLAGCSASESSSSPSTPDDAPVAQSTQERITSPDVPQADADALRDGNTAFAADLYQTLASDQDAAGKNLFFSPYSLSIALAMTYAGARGETATQMASALHYTLPSERLHPAFDALDLALSSRGQGAKADDGKAFRLRVANSVWGAPQTTFVPAYLDTLAANYGAGVRLTDFESDPEAARVAINGWVDTQTEDKIKDLIPTGTLTAATRLVLVNAIYFNAAWASPFEASATRSATFHGAGGDATVQMMTQGEEASYAAGDGWKAVALPYDGNELSFVAVLPDDLSAFEGSLDAAKIAAITGALAPAAVELSLPKFEIPGASFSVRSALTALGMKDAFEDAADFSGMASSERLHISDVIHQAFISVDEAGTEAAAATAVIAAGTAAHPDVVELTFDKPFVFFVRDDATGAILFEGRVVAP